MKQVLVRQGQVVVEEIPAPMVEAGTVLVRVDHSCISIGTEMNSVRSSGRSLWKRVLDQPEKVKEAFDMVAARGLSNTINAVQVKFQAGQPTGYSAAGTVLAVGAGIDDLGPGDRVACAGAQCAYHAEIIRVPRNLAVKVPDGVSFAEASTVTLGAIAMQGVRRAHPTLGEVFVVIGLGVLGQLTVQMLKANGCRVIALDLDRDRIATSRELGGDFGVHPDDGVDIEQVTRLTGGFGADGVIITAATSSNAVVSTAFRMCRKKGRVVLVGDVGLNLRRGDFYQKEIDFLISTSYGPGRYDTRYEEQGIDYPLAYVRWTENRNMEAYLQLVSEGKVRVAPLIAEVYPLEQATAAYDALKAENSKPLMVLLQYPQSSRASCQTVVPNPKVASRQKGGVGMAVVGAGSFARGMHLPNLKALSSDFSVQAVVSRSGQNALSVSHQFGAAYASTDFRQVLEDQEVDAVLISTRHNLHAEMALAALQAGKHVLLEKPLALTREELKLITSFYETDDRRPMLLTGFNRRFSPFARRIKELVSQRSNPMILNYRMNAGYIPLDHWVHGAEGGGRNIGEACHIYDLFTFLVGAKVAGITAAAIAPTTACYGRNDNFVTTITFADGSICTLTYTALGNKEYPKEKLDVYVDGKVLVLDDYVSLAVHGGQGGMRFKTQDKGHKQELVEFARALRSDGEWPIPLWEQVQAAEIAFSVESMLNGSD